MLHFSSTQITLTGSCRVLTKVDFRVSWEARKLILLIIIWTTWWRWRTPSWWFEMAQQDSTTHLTTCPLHLVLKFYQLTTTWWKGRLSEVYLIKQESLKMCFLGEMLVSNISRYLMVTRTCSAKLTSSTKADSDSSLLRKSNKTLLTSKDSASIMRTTSKRFKIRQTKAPNKSKKRKN